MKPQNGFLRFGVILLGYLAACFVAGVVMSAMVIGLGKEGFERDFLAALAFPALVITPFIGFFAGIPAAFAIAAGESIPRRDWCYYTLCGLVAGVLLLGFFILQGGFETTPNGGGVDLPFAMMMLFGGTAAGFTYWAVAGRNAGAAALQAADRQ